jgi:hypothetical protein
MAIVDRQAGGRESQSVFAIHRFVPAADWPPKMETQFVRIRDRRSIRRIGDRTKRW